MSRNLENKKKSASSAGGGGGGRSQVTGVKLGKGARRALNKNADCIDDFLSIIQGSKTLDELTGDLADEALTLGRVTRSTGCGRLEVTALNIESCAYAVARAKVPISEPGVSVPICGTLKFKGRSNTKADRANCMCVGDVIVLRGGLASAKMSAAAASVVRRTFERYGMLFPANFFSSTAEAAGAVAAEEDGFEFDRSEELAEEEEEVAKLRAEAARARAARAGGAKAASSDEELDIDAI